MQIQTQRVLCYNTTGSNYLFRLDIKMNTQKDTDRGSPGSSGLLGWPSSENWADQHVWRSLQQEL